MKLRIASHWPVPVDVVATSAVRDDEPVSFDVRIAGNPVVQHETHAMNWALISGCGAFRGTRRFVLNLEEGEDGSVEATFAIETNESEVPVYHIERDLLPWTLTWLDPEGAGRTRRCLLNLAKLFRSYRARVSPTDLEDEARHILAGLLWDSPESPTSGTVSKLLANL